MSSNGDSPLPNRTKGPLLNWSKLFKIITGLTKGIVYLHKHSMFWLVHRDLKPHNVLLDCNMIPKIADFVSARALSLDVAQEHTSRVMGTSGRKNTILDKQGDTVGDLVRDFSHVKLVENYFRPWRMWKEQRLHELVDPLLGDGYEVAEIMKCAQVALVCAQEDLAYRPAMTNVAAMLNSESISLPMEPKQPGTLIHGCADRDTTSTYVGQSSRTIDITITSSAPTSTRV
ncbi:Putative cysteine-rich receptor-like protein kinase 20 [Triticum urartu]|uniref:non-specific serine/threonine protein kinase n=1 Tax=Triticum urartu TaxID=4572 RepID=M7ZZF7_TRIUA|nr:Putative cysteine-rich receptor-like protein kinase 20 [Triticum urartu]